MLPGAEAAPVNSEYMTDKAIFRLAERLVWKPGNGQHQTEETNCIWTSGVMSVVEPLHNSVDANRVPSVASSIAEDSVTCDRP
ncbi:hypothetical protein PHMEG_00010822 [Phytophthora megakarya]|uniref:Uncharacterized protein n=1 Tax=Phytophthora megakarya TaxID=4795 RepID=A0A225WCQ3_9STRA|nr:hypothetical protein PHMEG_00010822 [Phytophthora megakarya]